MPHRRLELAPRIALALALIVAPAIVVTSSSGDVDPAHKVRYERLSSSGTRFYNYDGSTRTRRAADRDWPIDFIFYRGASISKVKDLMRDIELVVPGGSMYEGYRYSYGSPRRFDSDRGVKDVCDLSYNDEHIRVYASVGSDRFYDDRYGFFVVGSSHQDHADGCGDPDSQYFGYSEFVEERIVDELRDEHPELRITSDHIPFNNQEDLRFDARDPRHVWLNDGRATAVRVP